MKFQIYLLLGLFFSFSQLNAQNDSTSWLKRTAKNVFGEEAHAGEARLLAYPTIGYAPETSFEIGISAVLLYYAKKDYEKNRLSEVRTFSFFTLQRQYGIWLDHDLYGDEDKWFFLGKIRQQRFPLLYFGIGPDLLEEDANLVDASYTLIKERVLRKVVPNLFVGLEFDYQRLYNTEFESDPIHNPLGTEGSQNLGLGVGLVYDNRHNVLNVREGFFAEVAYLRYAPAWGSDFDFNGVYSDFRYFRPMSADHKQVLAAQLVGTFVNGDVPFNQLALIGGEQLMRGYYLGRYRDNNLVAGQIEYRFLPFPFSKRLGGAAFLGAGTVAPTIGDLRLSQLKVTGGAGIRFLLFPSKDIYVRFDVAFSEDGPGFYFFTGEAF
ncbi:MAG: BamA/TamA family outer membrane protein [Bacteroidota bacterium]